VKHIRNVSLVAGPYDLVSMLPHFEERGLYRNVVAGIMGGLERLPQMSPAVLVREHQALFRAVTASVQCPPVYLFHGTSDTAVPFTSAVDFCSALVDAGCVTVMILKRCCSRPRQVRRVVQIIQGQVPYGSHYRGHCLRPGCDR